MKYYFKSIRVKKDKVKNPNPKIPDYDNEIILNKNRFQLTGWFSNDNCDINYVLTFRFVSIRVKRETLRQVQSKSPDYLNEIKLNNRMFKLAGWLGDTNSDISYTLEESK